MLKTTLKNKLLLGAAGVALAAYAAPALAAAGADGQQVNTAGDVAVTSNVTGANATAPAANNPGDAGGDGISIETQVDADVAVTGATAITGGNGSASDDTNANGGLAGGAGGAGIIVDNADGTAAGDATRRDVSVATGVTVTGGTGGQGADQTLTDDTADTGGAGGAGLSADSNFFNFESTGGTVTGGAGGVGGQATDGDGGSTGGTGGAGGVGVAGTGTTADINLNASVTGGAGGAGGAAANGASDGGAGGAGGTALFVDGTDWDVDITGSSTVITGGAGGAGGTGGSANGANGAAGHGIDIDNTGANVNIGTGVIVRGGTAGAGAVDGAGVIVDSTGSTIINAGTVEGGDSGAGIALDVNAAVTTLTNSGTVGSTSAAGVAMDVDGTIATFSNSGTVAAGAADAMAIDQVITSFTNSGTISSASASAIDLNAALGGTSATLTGGTITTAGTGTGNAALEIGVDQTASNAFTLTGGSITNTRTADNNGIAVEITTSQTDGNALIFSGTTTISSIGSGTAAAPTGVALSINTTSGTELISNAGTILGQIIDGANEVVTLTNTGTITGAITLNGSGATNLTNTSGTINGAVDLGDGANNLTMTAGTLTGTVTGGTAVDTVDLNGGTIIGDLSLDAQNDVLNANGGTLTGNTEFGAGVNVLNIDENFTTGGTFAATGGTVNVAIDAAKTLTLNHAVTRAGTITLAAGSVLNVNETNVTTQGALTNTGGTINVAAGKTLDIADHTAAAGGVFNFLVSDATTFGSINVSAGDLDLTGSSTTVSVVGSNFIADGTEMRVANGTGAVTGEAADGTVLTDDSFIYTFRQYQGDNAAIGAASDNTELWLEVSRADLGSVGSTSVNKSVGAVLDSLGATTNTELALIQGNIGAASSQEAVDTLLESVAPTVDGGSVVAATSVTTQTSNLTQTRLASLRANETSMAAGNMASGMKVWAQGFGSTGEQDERDNVAGYDVDTYGLSVGADAHANEDLVVGVALSYADTEVDSKNANSTNTDIESYQVTLYGEYDLDSRTYVSGQVGYVWGNNDSTRTNVGGTGLNAVADYDSNAWVARVEAGRDYAASGNMVLTPKALVNYMHYDADDYTETGAGGAGLSVDNETLNLFEVGVGVDASWNVKNADGSSFKPVIGVGVRHDLIGDEVETTSRFTGGGNSFRTQGFDPAQTTFDAGVGLTYAATSNWELTAQYDYEYKEDFDGHSGSLKAALKF